MFPFRQFLYNFTPRYLEPCFKSVTGQKKKQCTEVQNIEFINKQQCQFFVVTFISPQFKFSVHPCVVNQSFLLDSFENINLQLLLPLKWRVHDTCIPIPSIYLFPYFGSISSRTQFFFNFPWRFELSGVDCISRFQFSQWLNNFSHVDGLKAMLCESAVHGNDLVILQFVFLRLLHFNILRSFPRKRRLKKLSMFLQNQPNKQTDRIIDYNFPVSILI